jgi:hypothetical protein
MPDYETTQSENEQGSQVDFVQHVGASFEIEFLENDIAIRDTTPPIVQTITASPLLNSNTPVVFTVFDLKPGVATACVLIQYSGDTDYRGVFDGGVFLGSFVGSSSVISIPNGLTFSILPQGGWISAFTLRAYGVDLDGAKGGL